MLSPDSVSRRCCDSVAGTVILTIRRPNICSSRLKSVDDRRNDVLERILARPPIVEALVSIEFRPRGFDVIALVHESDRWAERYPVRSQQPALPATRPPNEPFLLEVGMQFGLGTQPLRIWSASEDQQWLVQNQDDRLALNWRRVTGGPLYPGFGAIGQQFSKLLSELRSEPAPVVADFTYVNDVTADFEELHETYSIFRKPTKSVPGHPLETRLQEIRLVETAAGSSYVTTTIEPIQGDGAAALTRLTISAKLFVAESATPSAAALVGAAHDTAKSMFFAVVSDQATSQWGEQA